MPHWAQQLPRLLRQGMQQSPPRRGFETLRRLRPNAHLNRPWWRPNWPGTPAAHNSTAIRRMIEAVGFLDEVVQRRGPARVNNVLAQLVAAGSPTAETQARGSCHGALCWTLQQKGRFYMGASGRSPQNRGIPRDTAWYVAFAGVIASVVLLAIWILPAALALSPGGGPKVPAGRASYFDYVCAVLVCISTSVVWLARRQVDIAELQRKPSIAWSLGPLAAAIGLALFLFGVKTHLLRVFAEAGPLRLPSFMWVGMALLFGAFVVAAIDARRIWVTRKAEQARRDAGPGSECRPAR